LYADETWFSRTDETVVLVTQRRTADHKLVANVRVVKFLNQHFGEILGEFQRFVDANSAAA
jgi:hypothetical protein